MKRKTDKRQALLRQRLEELTALIKRLCPKAEVTLLPNFRYEDEDAVLKVFVPPEKYDEVEAAVTRRETEILWEDGLFIVTLVYEKKPVEPTTAT